MVDGRGRAGGALPVRIEGGDEVLSEILAGGQTFLWGRSDHGDWSGVHDGRVFRLGLDPDRRLRWELRAGDPEGAGDSLRRLFAADTDFAAIADALPWRSDPRLSEAVAAFPGLRVLRQPPGPTLLAFLLSPLKRIDQIRAGLLALSARFGRPLGDGFFAPPTWETLADLPEEDLRACGIGYRARSVHACARLLRDRPGFPESLADADTASAREALLGLPGVGRKIADCVLLFGLGRLEAFPVDTWIARELRAAYGLGDFADRQLQAFAAAHFGAHAGFAQQFLFAAARRRAARVGRD